MTVDSFDPKAMSGAVTDAQVAQWLAVAERCGVGGDAVAIEQVDHGLVASLFLPGWDNTCGELDNTALIKLIRLFTLGEMQHANWQTGAKSPVVPLVKLLKERGVFDMELGRWIKAIPPIDFAYGDLSALRVPGNGGILR